MAQFPIDIKIDTSDQNKLGPLNRQLNETDKAATAAASATRLLGVAVGVVASAASAGQLIRLADSYTKIQNSIVNVVSGTEELTQRTGQLLQVSLRSRSSFEATAALYGKLTRATEDLGISQDRILKITETINKGFVANGTATSAAADTIRQLGQALDSGVLRGDEFNSITEQAPAILRAVITETGMASKELREFAATGGITSELLIKAVENYADTIDREFGRSKPTFEAQVENAKSLATAYIGTSESIRTASEAAGATLVLLAENLDTVADAAIALGVVYGARLVGQIAAKTGKTVADTAATAASLKVEQAAAAAALRRAEAEAAAAVIQLKAARDVTAAKKAQALAEAAAAVQSQTATLQTAAETARAAQIAAAADAARLRATLENITAEQALEKTRLAAQISERGRIDTATRFAALGADRVEILKQINAAEKVLAATSKELTAAEIALSASQKASVVNTNQLANGSKALSASLVTQNLAVENLAQKQLDYSAAQAKVNVLNGQLNASTSLLTRTTDGLKNVMNALGGPVGVAILAGSALLYFANSADEAEKKLASEKLADQIEKLVEKYRELNNLGQRVTFTKLADEASDLRQKLVLANNEFQILSEAAFRASPDSAQGAGVIGAATRAQARVAELEKSLGAVVEQQKALFATRAPAESSFKGIKDDVKQTADEFTRLAEVRKGIDALFNNGLFGETPEGFKAAQQQIEALTRQAEALKLTGVEQAIYNNTAQLAAGSTDAQRQQIEALTRAIYAQSAAEEQRQYVTQRAAEFTPIGDGTALETPAQKLQREYDEREAILIGALSDELITFEEYKKRQTNLEAEYDKKRLEQRAATQSAIFTATAQGFDALAGIIDAAGGKQTKAYRVAYVASRAFALADSILKVTQASAQALADPTAITLPQKFANYTAIATAGAGLLSAFKQPAGFKDGGYTGNGGVNDVAGVVHGKEYVMPAESTKRYRGELEAMRRGTYGAATTTSAPRITINNYASDVATATVTQGSDGELIATIDRRIAEKTPDIVSQQLGDPYSPSTRTLNSAYRLERN